MCGLLTPRARAAATCVPCLSTKAGSDDTSCEKVPTAAPETVSVMVPESVIGPLGVGLGLVGDLPQPYISRTHAQHAIAQFSLYKFLLTGTMQLAYISYR